MGNYLESKETTKVENERNKDPEKGIYETLITYEERKKRLQK